ncbi:redoxin domain-containing protein [Nitratifractor sp.]
MPAQRDRLGLKRLAKEIILFLLVAVGVSTIIGIFRAPRSAPDPSVLAGLRTIDGRPVDPLLRGDGALAIHFWGSWCPVCRAEADNLERLAPGRRILTVAVSSGDAATLRRWMAKRGLHYPVIADPDGRLARTFGVKVYPSTFIYDGKGTLRFALAGYTTTPGLWIRMLWAQYQ